MAIPDGGSLKFLVYTARTPRSQNGLKGIFTVFKGAQKQMQFCLPQTQLPLRLLIKFKTAQSYKMYNSALLCVRPLPIAGQAAIL